MRLINKNSRRGVVNLFSEFVLSKINKTENSIIQVTDCGPFFVVNGLTTSLSILDLNKVRDEFVDWFSEVLTDVDIETINIIDLIKYGEKIKNIERGWVKVNRSLYVEEPEPVSEVSVSSEFPYGHSLNCGRLMVYYSHYIFNHCYSSIGTDDVYFYFTKELDEDDDFKIRVITSKGDKVDRRVKSMILDVFDFNLEEFSNKLTKYDLIHDVLDPNKSKPYLVQDRLKDAILF
jgi:hypothetical protein